MDFCFIIYGQKNARIHPELVDFQIIHAWKISNVTSATTGALPQKKSVFLKILRKDFFPIFCLT